MGLFISQVKWLCGSTSSCGVLTAPVTSKSWNAAQPMTAWEERLQPCPITSPCNEHIFHLSTVLFFSFPWEAGEQRCKMDWKIEYVCVVGMWSVSVMFLFINYLEECFLCVDSWLYRSRKETALLIRLILTGARSVFTGEKKTTVGPKELYLFLWSLISWSPRISQKFATAWFFLGFFSV